MAPGESQPREDRTLDAIRERLAPAIAAAAVFDGWSADAVKQAADATGVDADVAAYAFRGGAMEMIGAWIGHLDVAMAIAFPPEQLATLPVRERIRRLVRFRLDAQIGLEEALSRALATMALPRNAARAARLGWRSADRMWRLAGDTATDYNHYTKRAILAAIYAATLSVFASDESEGKAETWAFLDRRIAGIMRFEKTKAALLRRPEERFSMARFLGRLRYPAN
ncbi:COQ9 family protein [Novosphingobium album (ex Liu et al. 2023)]|uniref:COQ9 family protein n=1 Tax=Novosphingobium album (ex Liu et al. 2023) TaxID=3031130 RepID=A0ABT5WSY1_9SPHN|nr:COQ9 family protein [Novosphingobium album (ex Liu et al. 2023)]MDE8653149.1 COQ9 family protein [Novosphingobium album (ex Liu et al. 2023)]